MTSPLRKFAFALGVGVIAFVPVERLIDSWFPGNHAGFGLLGVWFWFVLPASILLFVALGMTHRQANLRSAEAARRIEYGGWLLTGLIYIAATWLYRRSM